MNDTKNTITASFTASTEIAQLASALTKAQGTMQRSRQEILPAIQTAIGDALSANGLSYVQRAHDKPGQVSVETILLHESGEFMSAGILSVPITAEIDLTVFGSTMNAVRTHSLASAFGITPIDPGAIAAVVETPASVDVPVAAASDQSQQGQDQEDVGQAIAAVTPVVSDVKVFVPPVAAPAADVASPTVAEAVVNPEDAELVKKIGIVCDNKDLPWLNDLPSRVNGMFQLQENRNKFLDAVAKRIAALTSAVITA